MLQARGVLELVDQQVLNAVDRAAVEHFQRGHAELDKVNRSGGGEDRVEFMDRLAERGEHVTEHSPLFLGVVRGRQIANLA